MWQHDAAAAQPAPALGRAQHPKKDLLAASAALVSCNRKFFEIWSNSVRLATIQRHEWRCNFNVFNAKQAWVEARRPYTDALRKASGRDGRGRGPL